MSAIEGDVTGPPATGGSGAASTAASGVPAPAPDRVIRPRAFGRRHREVLLAVTVVAAVLPVFVDGFYGMGVATKIAIYVILSMGFYFQFALSGQFSFATTAFYAVGAYTSIWASGHGGFVVGVVAAAAATGVLGALVRLALGRSPLIQFAIATISFSALTLIVLRYWESFTGGATGRYGVAPVSLFGYDFDTPTKSYYAVAGVALLGVLLLILFERSPGQRDLVFVRDMGNIAKTTGLSSLRMLVVSFGIGAAYMGVAGSVAAHTSGFVDITSFPIDISLDVLLMVLLGGVASLWGPVVGGTLLVLLPEYMRSIADYKDLVYAVIILVVILVLPNGLASLPSRMRSAVATWRHRSKRDAPREPEGV